MQRSELRQPVVYLATAVLLLAVGSLFPGLAARSLAQGAAPVAGPGARLRASLEPGIIGPGERATLVVTVEGVEDPPFPGVKASPGVTVRPLVRRQIGGGTAGTEFSYGVAASAEGTYTVGPAELRVGQSVQRSEPMSLRVARTKVAPRVEGQEGGDVFLKASLDDRTPYVGEQVVYTVKIFRSVNIFKQEYDSPTFEGLIVAGQPVKQTYSTLEGDRNLDVEEYRYALFPIRSGAVRIGDVRFACKIKVGTKAGKKSLFDDEYTGRSEDAVAVAPAIDLHVKPLPPGAEDFAGLVGPTDVIARVDPAEVKEGGTTTLTVEVRSTGNLLDLAPPKVDGITAFQAISDSPKAELAARDEGKFLGRKVFKTALIASRTGSYDIAPVHVSFFDPATGTYKTAKSGAQRIAVLQPGQAASRPAGAAGAGRGTALALEEIRGIRAAPTRLSPRAFSGTPGIAWLVLSGVPFVGFVVARVVGRHLDRVRTDVAYARGRRAVRAALAKLDQAREIAPEGKAGAFFGLVNRAIREYVGDRLNVPGSALTPQEIEARIREAGVMDGVEVEVREFLLSCEYRQIATGEAKEKDRVEFLERAQALLTRLEKELPR